MVGPDFLIKPLFGQYTANYMICYHFLTLFSAIELVISFLRLKKPTSKKGSQHSLRLETAFQTKKQINILNEPGPRNLGCQMSHF